MTRKDGSRCNANPRMYLLDDCEPGKDQGEETWYADRHVTFTVGKKNLKGTIRSMKCHSFVTQEIGRPNMCKNCANIEHLNSFRCRLFSQIQILWHYLEVFQSPVASLKQRIQHASVVFHFLGIWHNYVHRTPGMLLTTHFIT